MIKKILIVTTKYGEKENKWLTNELAEEFVAMKKKVSVVALSWMESDPETKYEEIDNIKIYRYKAPKILFKKNIFIKFFKQFLFGILALRNLKKIIKYEEYDLIIGFSPAYLTNRIVKFYKNKTKKCYLILWDFFPFYLKDLSIIKNKILFSLLKKIENISYLTYDRVGCMTKKNKLFLIKNYKKIKQKNIEILPIWTRIEMKRNVDKKRIRKELGYEENDIIFVYGGAHTIVQELDNIVELAKKFENEKNIKFIFLGKGDDKERIKRKIIKEKINNIKLMDFIPREKYIETIASFDIGIVSLSSQLSVPSFPSKSLDYLKVGIPILASIDKNTDYGDILEQEMKAGYYSYATDIESLENNSRKLIIDKNKRIELGSNGYEYYKKNFSVKNIVELILKGNNNE